jgi:quinoprotein glucose dehydrogenase
VQFLRDPELLVEAARAINDVPIPAGFEALAKVTGSTNLPVPALLRALNVNFRLGTPEAAERLGAFIQNSNASDKLRAQAIEMLGNWARPDAVDRIVGLWRPLPERDGEPARTQIENLFPKLTSDKSEAVLTALLNTVRELTADVNPDALGRIFDDSAKSSKVRIEALQTLVIRNPSKSAEALVRALEAGDENIRLLACRLAADQKVSMAMPKLLTLAQLDGSVRVRQAALRGLRGSETPEYHSALRGLIEQLHTGACPESLRLEIISAVQASSDQGLKLHLAELQQSYSRALLAGGNAEEGSRIFHERQDVSCMRCHALNGNGGTVGPDLGHIGAKKAREYLLEAVATPNKTLAEGFEQLVLRMKDGTSSAGLLKAETADELVLDSPEDGILHVRKSEIEARIRNLSAMPEGLEKMLTPFEIRDLIEYLASLK